MSKLIPFPINILTGFIKKAAFYLPAEHRSPILASVKAKDKALLEKTKLLVTAIMVAKQLEDTDEFEQEVKDAFSLFTLNTHELALFDGFLGSNKSMLLEMAKRGVTPERLKILRTELASRYQ